jgi:uncharacterized protein (DUF427 family)
MNDKTVKIPGPDHPISIQKNSNHIVVKFGERVIADTTRALTLREASYAPTLYIPEADIDFKTLVVTTHYSHCPYKGDCTYHSIKADGKTAENAVWSYQTPYDAVAEIKGHYAFYPDKVSIKESQ